MTVYLASPNSALQADYCRDMPVLLSYALWSPWVDKWHPSFDRILIDSGAYSEMNSGKVVDGHAYKDWSQRWAGLADAVAGLDDIRGDYKRSLDNYEKFGGFPTMHDTDPPELIHDLIALAQERGAWIGLGLLPPREGKEHWVRWACDQLPDDLHIHGWALRRYTGVRRLDSVDSTNWWKDALDIRSNPLTKHLTPGECLEIVVKRYKRWDRVIKDVNQAGLFDL